MLRNRIRLWWHLRRGHAVVPARGIGAIAIAGGLGAPGFYCKTCRWLAAQPIAPLGTPMPTGWSLSHDDAATVARWQAEAGR